MSQTRDTDLWVAFDLDDTLHDFRGASSKAMARVYGEIAEQYGSSPEVLRQHYRQIVSEETRGAFADGQTSTYYRSRRMARLLAAVNVDPSPQRVARLVTLYKRALLNALRITPGAYALLRSLRTRGYRIAVISEGPSDAQEWTLQRLGIAQFVDLLVTSGEERKTKTEGLFERARHRIGPSHSSPLFIGDSLERDVHPAAQAGFRSVLFDPSGKQQPAEVAVISTLDAVWQLIA